MHERTKMISAPEKEVFTDRYEITVMGTLTSRTGHDSYLVYKLPPPEDKYGEKAFIALFAREGDAYEYVAMLTAIDAGVEKQRVLDALGGLVRAKSVEIALQLEEEEDGTREPE